MFDFRRRVHLCEVTPSYELHWLETIYSREFSEQHETERDQLESDIMDGNREQSLVEYMHTHTDDALPFIDLSESFMSLYDEAKDEYDEEDKLHEAIMDASREHEQGNPSDYHSLIRKGE